MRVLDPTLHARSDAITAEAEKLTAIALIQNVEQAGLATGPDAHDTKYQRRSMIMSEKNASISHRFP